MLLTINSSTTNSTTPENFTITFPGIELKGPHEIALVNANLMYSWQNIADYLNNNDIRISNGTRWINIKIPNGIYDIEQLNDFINRELIAKKEDPEIAKIVPN